MDDKVKKIKRMAAWTTAIFATVFAVTFASLWLVNYNTIGKGLAAIGAIFAQAWIIIVIDLVLCGGVFLGYKYFLDRKS